MSKAVCHVTAVMCDTNDLQAAVDFWGTILDIDVAHRDDRYVYLNPMVQGGPHLAFQLVHEPRKGKNRLHFDVGTDDREALQSKVEELGGSLLYEATEPGYPVWLTFADSQGNEFGIYQK